MENKNFEVDVVYTWVNHRDPDWAEMHKKYSGQESLPKGSHTSVNSIARYQNRDEIYYSILSIKRFTPWIRKIFIVTNCALPQWAKLDNQIHPVCHSEIFPNKEDLPTFNAFAIENCLHRIKGLSEHFLYLNDDFFILKPIEKEFFFSKEGVASVFPSHHDIPKKTTRKLRPIENSMLLAKEILEKDHNFTPKKKLAHAPYPLLRSVLFELEERYFQQVKSTRSHKFRNKTDLPLSTTLHAYYCIAKGNGIEKKVPARYINIGNPLFIFLIAPSSGLMRGKYTFLCLNEVNSMPIIGRLRDKIVIALMKKIFLE